MPQSLSPLPFDLPPVALAKCNQKSENKRALLVLFTVQSASEDTKQVRRVEKGLEEKNGRHSV